MSNTINQTQANSIDQKYALLNAKNKNTDSTETFKTTTKWSGSTSNVDPSITQEVLNSLSKDYANIEGLKPIDISFEDYEKMSYKALEVIFEGNGDFIGKASGLMATAQLTEDKILNKIFFDDFSKAQKEGTTSKYSQVLLMTGILDLDINIHIDPNTLSDGDFLKTANKSSNSNFLSQSTNEKASVLSTKDSLLKGFDDFRDFYYNGDGNWTNNFDMSVVFKNMDEIKNLYNQKVQENEAILSSIMKDTKQQAI